MSMEFPPGAPIDLQVGAYIFEEWLVVATIPALAPINTQTAATIARAAGAAALAQVQSPGSEIWHVENIYTLAVPVPDVQLVIIVNGTPQSTTLLASTVLVTNFQRPGWGYSWRLQRSAIVTFSMVNIAAVGALPIVVQFRVKVGRFKIASQ